MTASSIARGSRARPAAERPMRPEPRAPARRAIASARSAGQPGYNRWTSPASCSWNATSSWARRACSRSRRLAQDPLALIPLAGPAEADHDRSKAARLLRPPRERRVARRQEDEVVHVRAAHADRPLLLHHDQAAVASALGAGPRVERGDHDQVRRSALALGEPRPLRLGEVRRDPVRAVGALDPGVAALRELERAPVARA